SDLEKLYRFIKPLGRRGSVSHAWNLDVVHVLEPVFLETKLVVRLRLRLVHVLVAGQQHMSASLPGKPEQPRRRLDVASRPNFVWLARGNFPEVIATNDVNAAMEN